MSFVHETRVVSLPGGSTTPVLICRFNTASLQSLMLQCSGGDAKVLGTGRSWQEGYVFSMGQQRIYNSADFARPGTKGEAFELWMCAAGSEDVNISVESISWSDF